MEIKKYARVAIRDAMMHKKGSELELVYFLLVTTNYGELNEKL